VCVRLRCMGSHEGRLHAGAPPPRSSARAAAAQCVVQRRTATAHAGSAHVASTAARPRPLKHPTLAPLLLLHRAGPIFPNRGDQEKFWKMTKRFTEELGESMGIEGTGINVVYPDAGVAAMLSFQFKQVRSGSFHSIAHVHNSDVISDAADAAGPRCGMRGGKSG
jgi:hypothetical protein